MTRNQDTNDTTPNAETALVARPAEVVLPPAETTPATDEQKVVVRQVEKIDLSVKMWRNKTKYWTEVALPKMEDLDKPSTYMLRRNGLWLIVKNEIGVFISHQAKYVLEGFPEERIAEGCALAHGPIPHEILQKILYFFKEICDESQDEVYIQVFWSNDRQEYFAHCPIQEVSKASVRFTREPELEANNVLVLEIHSHNTMGAFFSGTDDGDEKNDRLFAVVGQLDKAVPQMLFSFVSKGKRVIIPHESAFTPLPGFPQEWKKRITKRSYGVGSAGISRTTGWEGYEEWQKEMEKRRGGGYEDAWKKRHDSYKGDYGSTGEGFVSGGRTDFKDDVPHRGFTSVQKSNEAKTPQEITEEVERAFAELADENGFQVAAVMKSKNFMKDRLNQTSDAPPKTTIEAQAEVVVSKATPKVSHVGSAAHVVKVVSLPGSTTGNATNVSTDGSMKSREPEVSPSDPFFRGSAQGSSIANQSSSKIDREMGEWRRGVEQETKDRALAQMMTAIIISFQNQTHLEDEMTEAEKQRQFQELLSCLDEDDVQLFADTMVECGHAEQMMEALATEPDVVDPAPSSVSDVLVPVPKKKSRIESET